MKKILSILLLSSTLTTGMAADRWVQTPVGKIPTEIYAVGDAHHVQGVAVDLQRGYAYFSFTTSLVKTDLEGRVVGSVVGLSCHLGCIDLDPATGKLYGSMEYKDDSIGKGILQQLQQEQETPGNCFYIAIFDTEKIERVGINWSEGEVLKAVYLPDVVEMYEETVMQGGVEWKHRYGCSGIDGVAIGPQFGKQGGKPWLNVAFGVYAETDRTDNDYNVLLQYDLKSLDRYAQPLGKGRFHKQGPKGPKRRLFAYTGNTNWGVQNLEYDAASHYWFLAVYPGKKEQFVNYPLFTVDGLQKAQKQQLKGFDPKEEGWVVKLAEAGERDPQTGICGWNFPWGSTGFESLGSGYFYISHDDKTSDGKQCCHLKLYRWTGDTKEPFVLVKE